jgi:hypothetical protein
MDLNKATITVGVQTSREDDRTGRHILDMRKALALHCQGPYSPEIREFALILRVGGEMQEFDFESCDRIRRSRKEHSISVDLAFPSRKWKGVPDKSIREYISEAVETGLLCCIRRLELDKSQVDADRLLSDFARAKYIFLTESGDSKQHN